MPASATVLKKLGGGSAVVVDRWTELTNRLLFAGADVVTLSLTDQVIVRLGLVALGEAKVTKSSSVS